MSDQLMAAEEASIGTSRYEVTALSVKVTETPKRKRGAVLVCVPHTEPFESPASWVSRLAFNQIESPIEVMKFLGMWISEDPDLGFTKAISRRVARLCGFEIKEFAYIRRMLGSLRSIGAPTDFLLTVDRCARYRFCKACLREQRIKHFPLHWRFAAWRWCPEHECLLEDRCPHCDAFVTLPAGLARAAENRRARGTLDQCMVCNQTLWAKGRQRRFDLLKKFLSPWEHYLLQNGRAVLACMWKRSVKVQRANLCQVRPMSELLRLHRAGLLPHGSMRFDQSEQLPARYRHPLNDQIVADRPPARKKHWRGLFDGP